MARDGKNDGIVRVADYIERERPHTYHDLSGVEMRRGVDRIQRFHVGIDTDTSVSIEND